MGAIDAVFNKDWIRKEAVKPHVREELYILKKHAFSAPVKYAADGPVHKLFASLITKENIEKSGFLDWGLCKGLVQRRLSIMTAPNVNK